MVDEGSAATPLHHPLRGISRELCQGPLPPDLRGLGERALRVATATWPVAQAPVSAAGSGISPAGILTGVPEHCLKASSSA